MRSAAPLSRRALLTQGALAGVGVVLAACTRTPTSASSSDPAAAAAAIGAPGPRTFTSVAMIGDSITDGSTPALEAALTAAGLRAVTIDAQVSRRIEVGGGPGEPRSGTQAMRTLLDSGAQPDVWVIALGTNDVGQYAEDEYEPVVRSLLDMVPTGAPLVWVDTYHKRKLPSTKIFNRLLHVLIDGRGDAVVASWIDACENSDVDLLQDDELHPNEHGRERFAQIVVAALDELSSRA